jgi:prepilin-type N-terminal cleavage/methylation domain-containing protein
VRRLRQQAGFTLVELLVAISIGSVVMLATFSMLDQSVVLTGKTQKRVDVTQRGRLAMEQITRQIRSQACPNDKTPAVVGSGVTGQVASDQYNVDVWTFTGAGSFAPERHVITWDTNTNSIVERDYDQTGTLLRSKTLLSKVRPAGTNVPVFRYYGYPDTNGTFPNVEYTGTLSATNSPKVALIDIQYTLQPDTTATPASTSATPPDQSQIFHDQVFVRTADPNDPKGPQAPLCA